MAASKPKPEGNDGFVSSSKGITLSVVSLGVWILTLVFFQMADAIAKGKVDYPVFCLFASFILSVAVGIYMSKLIYQRDDKWRTLAIFLNILLIYSSANGIQAGHAAIAKAESQKTDKPISQLALFGLLDARPWLTDAISKEKIKSLTAENASLLGQVTELRQVMNANDQSGVVKNFTDANQNLHVENDHLKARVESLQGQLASENKDQLVQQLQNDISNLNSQLWQIQERIAKYNSIRNQWINKVNSDEKFMGFVSKFRQGIAQFMGMDYYDQLFNFELNSK